MSSPMGTKSAQNFNVSQLEAYLATVFSFLTDTYAMYFSRVIVQSYASKIHFNPSPASKQLKEKFASISNCEELRKMSPVIAGYLFQSHHQSKDLHEILSGNLNWLIDTIVTFKRQEYEQFPPPYKYSNPVPVVNDLEMQQKKMLRTLQVYIQGCIEK